jgi:hypothetical protein
MSNSPENADESLTRAGLIFLDDSAPPKLAPLDAWKKIIGTEVVPAAVVADDAPDYLERVEQEWREIAAHELILNGNAPFWIHVAGEGSDRWGWRKVRVSAHTEMAANLGTYPGEPEFVTMDLEERVVCGVTTEEHGIWIVVARI